jgi:hypothetical protein
MVIPIFGVKIHYHRIFPNFDPRGFFGKNGILSFGCSLWSHYYHIKPHGSKMGITIGNAFFSKNEKCTKTVPKRCQNGQKWTKPEKIKKKKSENLTLERNFVLKNGHFLSYVDAALVFSEKNAFLTLRFGRLNTDKV